MKIQFGKSMFRLVLALGVSGCLMPVMAQRHLGVMGNLPPQPSSGGVAKILVSPANYSGSCPVTIHFQGRVNYIEPGNGMTQPGPIPGWQINFNFNRSDGQHSGLMIAPVNTVTSTSYDWQISQSTQGWVALQGILEINGSSNHQQAFQSPHANFSVTCLQPAAFPKFHPANIHRGLMCPNPRLLRVLPGAGRQGTQIRLLAITRLPAQVYFQYYFQGQTQQVLAPQYPIQQLAHAKRHWLGVMVPGLGTVAHYSSVYVQDACGASNLLSFQYQYQPPPPPR